MHLFGEHDIGLHLDEQLGLEEGTKQNEDLKLPPPANKVST
jgi:hypothetical protein